MDELDFRKMHGLGNDFVIVDRRVGRLSLSSEQVQRIADRRIGVGFDQLLAVEPSDQADAFMRVYNPEGSEAEACGNGTRCVARLLMEELGRSRITIETVGGCLDVSTSVHGYVVDMGVPRFGWDEIPLAGPADTLNLDLELGPLRAPVAVNLGNPHVVFPVDDADAVPLAELGPELEHHPLFPERANIGVVEVRGPGSLRVRVWERGAGLTRACGSGACAALVAAARRDLCGRAATVTLDGGRLSITWTDRDRVLMAGPASQSFQGRFDPELLSGAPIG